MLHFTSHALLEMQVPIARDAEMELNALKMWEFFQPGYFLPVLRRRYAVLATEVSGFSSAKSPWPKQGRHMRTPAVHTHLCNLLIESKTLMLIP
jgi:hypothetical protein